MLIVLMPLPPRLCRRYSAMGVRLPKPFSVTTRTSASPRMASMATTELPRPQFYPPHSSGIAAHDAHLPAGSGWTGEGCGYKTSLSFARQVDTNKLISLFQGEGDEAAPPDVGKFKEGCFLHKAESRGEEEVAVLFEIGNWDHRCDPFAEGRFARDLRWLCPWLAWKLQESRSP